MRKGGAISLSFGMIFSIIMIIAILGVGFYAITFFLNMQNCTTTADFHKRFQQKIDNAWNAEIVSDEFYLDLPSKIKKVCFGDLENPGELRGNLVEIHEELRTFASMNQRENSNMFMYPAPSACKLGYKQVKNIDWKVLNDGNFVCMDNKDGKINFKIDKSDRDSLVKLLN